VCERERIERGGVRVPRVECVCDVVDDVVQELTQTTTTTTRNAPFLTSSSPPLRQLAWPIDQHLASSAKLAGAKHRRFASGCRR